MQTDNIPADELQVDDWFFVAGTLYRAVSVYVDKNTQDVTIQMVNPTQPQSTRHPYVLILSTVSEMQILNQ